MRFPRPKSPKSVREFINERIGVQTRDEVHKTELSNVHEEKEKEIKAIVDTRVVDPMIIYVLLIPESIS